MLKAGEIKLLQEVDRTVQYMQDEAANFPDQSIRGAQEEEFSLELALEIENANIIKKIGKKP